MIHESRPSLISDASDQPGSETDPLLPVIRREAPFIAAFAVATAVAAAVFAMRSPEVFEATSKIVVQGSARPSANMSMLAQFAGISLPSGGGVEASQYFPDLVEDDDFLGGIVRRKWLVDSDSVTLEHFWGLVPDTTRSDWGYRYEKQKINRLKKGAIKLEKSENGLILLSTRFGHPQLALQINDYVVGQLDRYLLDKMRTSAKQTRNFVESRLAEAESQLRASEIAVTEFMERNQGVSAPKLLLTMKRLQRDVTVNQEIFLELKKQYEMARIEEQKSQALLDVISRATLPIDRIKPNRKQIVAGGLFVGLILGSLAALLRHWIRERARMRVAA